MPRAIWKRSTGGKATPRRLTLYQSLAGSTNPKDVKLRHYLWINASRFDLIDENKPFVGTIADASGARILSSRT